MGVLQKYLFIQLWETLTCPEVSEADHGKCTSHKTKSEKWFYNEDSKILVKFSSHLKLRPQKQNQQKESAVKGATASILFGVHVWFGFGTCVLPGSPVLVQKCVRKYRENFVSLRQVQWDLLGIDATSTHLWQLQVLHSAHCWVA